MKTLLSILLPVAVFLITIGTAFCIGGLSSRMGFGVNTPVYWFVTIPICVLLGVLGGRVAVHLSDLNR